MSRSHLLGVCISLYIYLYHMNFVQAEFLPFYITVLSQYLIIT